MCGCCSTRRRSCTGRPGAGSTKTSVPLGGDARPHRLRVVTNPPAPARTDVWLAGDPPTIARYRVQTPATRLYLPVARKSS